jgi:predicted PurR-regulated permease PerM
MTQNINFIKGFTIFSIIYLLFTGLVSDKAIYDNLGGSIVALNKFIDLIFVLVFIYYLYEVFRYTRYLVNEKCKCSTDMRREIIMIGSVIEMILIFIIFVLQIIIFTILSVIFNLIKSVEDGAGDLKGAIRDPVGSLSKIPSKLRSSVNDIKSGVNKITKQIGKVKNISR